MSVTCAINCLVLGDPEENIFIVKIQAAEIIVCMPHNSALVVWWWGAAKHFFLGGVSQAIGWLFMKTALKVILNKGSI